MQFSRFAWHSLFTSIIPWLLSIECQITQEEHFLLQCPGYSALGSWQVRKNEGPDAAL